ncbi:MAG: gliding motility lipoprotein GldD [Porphyromonadaceae bacterium]|nr:MAG: gliding motility lipoprotein GldD [Porphyromonadaceae bacterium]
MKSSPVEYLILFAMALVILGCRQDYTPKPRAYYRIDLPNKEYQLLSGDYPYRFEYPSYARIHAYQGKWKDTDTADYWIDVEFPQFNSRVHLTYKTVKNNLANLIEDAHTYAYKHSIKADAIIQSEYVDSLTKVYSVLFDIKGNTASSVQFYATDSVRHFLRGALYFDCEPNKDSLAPVREFLRVDLIKMIESLTWRNLPVK